MPTGTFARSYGLRLTVLACTHLQGQSPDLEAALDQGNRAVDVLARVASHELPATPATCSTGAAMAARTSVADLTHRIRRVLTSA